MTKVTVYVDDSVWLSFKKQVFQKHGNLRKLSSEVEKKLRDEIIEEQITSGFNKIQVPVKGTMSSQEIKATRPKLRGPPSQEIVKEMRQKRLA
jgi:hypothetical protein